MSYKNPSKIPPKFCCKCCDYNTCSKKDYDKHVTTVKHQNRIKSYIFQDFELRISPTFSDRPYICECGKSYKYRQGLYAHKKKMLL